MLVDTGRAYLLTVITAINAADVYQMGLYTNNYALAEGDTFSALTEMTGAGYARVSLTGWAAPTGPVGGVWDTVANNVVFSNGTGSPITVYGFFVFGIASGVFYGGDLFSSPLTIPAGSPVVITPSWQDTTL